MAEGPRLLVNGMNVRGLGLDVWRLAAIEDLQLILL